MSEVGSSEVRICGDLTLTSPKLTSDGRTWTNFRGYLTSLKACNKSKEHGQRLHSQRARKDMSGNVALLLPKPSPQPRGSHQFACLFTFTKLMTDFLAERWHLFPLLTE